MPARVSQEASRHAAALARRIASEVQAKYPVDFSLKPVRRRRRPQQRGLVLDDFLWFTVSPQHLAEASSFAAEIAAGVWTQHGVWIVPRFRVKQTETVKQLPLTASC